MRVHEEHRRRHLSPLLAVLAALTLPAVAGALPAAGAPQESSTQESRVQASGTQESAPQEGTAQEGAVQEGAPQEGAPQTELPPAREIIDAYVEAIGGEELVRSFESRRATGTFEVRGQGVTGTVEIRSAAPNRLAIELLYEGVGAVRTGFDGEVGWSIDPITGPRVLRGQELDQLRDDADFYGDLHDPEKYVAVETLAREEFGGHDTWKVRLERPSGRVYFEYFDVETGLMVGNEGEQASMMGTLDVVSVLGDYREFDGLRIATRVTQDFGMGQTAVTVLDHVEHGTLSAEDFALPPQIEALIQQ